MKNNNEPAFPHTPKEVITDNPIGGGMTIRDVFAGQIISEFIHMTRLAHQDKLALSDKKSGDTNATWAARQAYEVADAMLEERDKE